MLLSKEQQSVKYLLRSRERTSDFPNRRPPDNLCRLFWETLIRAVVESAVVFVAGLALLGTFFIVLYTASGMSVPDPDQLSIIGNLMIPLGLLVLLFVGLVTGALIILAALEGIKFLWNKIPQSDESSNTVKKPNVAFEYAKSLKDRWCPMIQYKEDLK